MLDTKIAAKKLVNEFGLNEKIKSVATKKEIKKISNKGRVKSRAK